MPRSKGHFETDDNNNTPFPEGWGRTKPGSRKGAPVVRPAGFSSVTPYVVRQVTRFTRSLSASFDSSSLACSNLDTQTKLVGGFGRDGLCWASMACQVKSLPEHEVTEEGVTLAHSEIIQQGLWHVTGVFEEAGQASKHVHNLKGWQVIGLLHVLNARSQTLLLCRETERLLMCTEIKFLGTLKVSFCWELKNLLWKFRSSHFLWILSD